MAVERPMVEVKKQTPIRSEVDLNAQTASSVIKSNEPIDPKDDLLQGFKSEMPADDVDMPEAEKEGRRRMAEFYALPLEEQVGKIATMLDRGVVFERLLVPNMPDDLHYEWCRNDPLDIDRMRTLGFWVDTNYAPKRALHSDGGSAAIVGDVICVVTTKQNKEMIDRVRNEQTARSFRASKRGRGVEDLGEGEGAESLPDSDIPTFSLSSQRQVSAADVAAALLKADSQTRVQR